MIRRVLRGDLPAGPFRPSPRVHPLFVGSEGGQMSGQRSKQATGAMHGEVFRAVRHE